MPNDRPNILFCFPDQHRPDFVAGDDDLPVRTPYLDELAARGVRFTRAHCASPPCAPSRACLASGRPIRSSSVILPGRRRMSRRVWPI